MAKGVADTKGVDQAMHCLALSAPCCLGEHAAQYSMLEGHEVLDDFAWSQCRSLDHTICKSHGSWGR